MYVIHVLNFFLPAQIAGTEVYVLNLIRQQLALKIRATVLIPGYAERETTEYRFEGVRVIKYAEPSIVDRALKMGKRIPEGLPNFKAVLDHERPDIVHFHELGGSNGITIHHLTTAKSAQFKIVFTFHLSGYTCKTGHLMLRDKTLCDGEIRIRRCAECYTEVRHGAAAAGSLTPPGMLLFKLGADMTEINSKIGTALAAPMLIKQLQSRLQSLWECSDQVVSLTHWYRKILLVNGVPEKKISLITQAVPDDGEVIHETQRLDSSLKMIFIGRISKFKGLHTLLAALRRVKANVSLDVYGSVNEEKYATACIEAAKGLPVEFKGVLAPKEIRGRMANYDLLCLPSAFSEMSPLVIQEAFSVKLPVLASDVYGNREQISDGVNGWLFKFKSPNDLAQKIELLACQRVLINEAKKQIGSVKNFSSVAAEYTQVYNTILTA